MLFGPDSEIVRTSILQKVAEWVRDDDRDPDRWYLLGLMLHYEGDARARLALNTARQLQAGDNGHITALLAVQNELPLTPAAEGGKPALLPELPPLPIANFAAHIQNPAPNRVPALSNQPTPLIVVPPR